MKRRFFSLSGITFLFIATAYITSFFILGIWKTRDPVNNDIVSYYAYVPSTFIHKDPSMHYVFGDPFFRHRAWGEYVKDKGLIQKYTGGLAFFYTPFFLMGHAYAGITGYPQDGYSLPYLGFLQFSGLFYALAGLWVLRKILRRYFKEGPIALTLLCLALGTNLEFYSINEGPMPHAAMFFAITTFIFFTLRFFETQRFRHAILLGLFGGLTIWTRPNHVFIWVIPILYGISFLGGWKNFLAFLKEHWKKILATGITAFICFIPQLIYWKYMSGKFLAYSYGEEGFFWTQPEFYKVLFGFRKGWLIYTPIMTFACAGFLFMGKQVRNFRFAIPVFFIFSLYILASWWCWWYGGSFGMRPLIDIYGAMAIPMAAFFTFFFDRIFLSKIVLPLICAFLMFFNNFQSLQCSWGILHYDSMTLEAWKGILWQTEYPPNYDQMVRYPDYKKSMKSRWE